MANKSLTKQNRWTVMCLYPDYATGDYGSDLYMEWATCETAMEAEGIVQRKAHNANKTIPADDFKVICVLAGEHWNVMQLNNDTIDNLYKGVKSWRQQG